MQFFPPSLHGPAENLLQTSIDGHKWCILDELHTSLKYQRRNFSFAGTSSLFSCFDPERLKEIIAELGWQLEPVGRDLIDTIAELPRVRRGVDRRHQRRQFSCHRRSSAADGSGRRGGSDEGEAIHPPEILRATVAGLLGE